MKKLWQKHAGVVLLLGCLAAVAGFALLVLLPGRRTVVAGRAQILQQRAVMAEANVAAARLDDLERQVVTARSVVQQWRARAANRQLAGLLNGVTRQADEAGVELHSLQPLAAEPLKSVERHRVDLILEGGFRNLHEFLRRLESLPESVWVDRLSISESGKEEATLRCKLSLSIFGQINDISD